MCDETIQISSEAKRRLELCRQEGESYEDVLLRFMEQDKWAGFGILGDSDGDLQEGMEQVRQEMREGMEPADPDSDR